jgi:magnesium chelatase family protein
LLDRIDLHVEVPRLPAEALHGPPEQETSSEVAARVGYARERQQRRQGCSNAHLAAPGIAAHCQLDADGWALMQRATRRLSLSARGHHRVLRTARTIADLADSPTIAQRHLAEAIGLRQLDRQHIVGCSPI